VVVVITHWCHKCQNIDSSLLPNIIISTACNTSVTFQCLRNVREEVFKALGIGSSKIELSMGMSDDFEHAVSDIYNCNRSE
jgi:uncharacterized pyridoxal phosphate-containing UPF0001 family protein